MIFSMMRRGSRKLRRTFTLSQESLAYLDRETRRQNSESYSAVLDEILREKTREQKLSELEANIAAYYDSLAADELTEQREWGELTKQTLALNEEELANAQSAAGRDLVHEVADRSSGKRKAPGRDRVGKRTKQSSAR
jgi:hypothetical protein